MVFKDIVAFLFFRTQDHHFSLLPKKTLIIKVKERGLHFKSISDFRPKKAVISKKKGL